MAAVMECERKLGNGLALVVRVKPFTKDERPTVTLAVRDADRVLTIFTGIPGEIRDLSDWLDTRMGEVDDMHGMMKWGWRETA